MDMFSKIMIRSLFTVILLFGIILSGQDNNLSNVQNQLAGSYLSIAMKFDQAGQYEQALLKLKKIIENQNDKDYIRACFMLAEYYYHSRKGIPQDKNKAIQYYDIVLNKYLPDAEQGDPQAQYMVGLSLRYAKFKNDEAFYWLGKSAEKGYALAQAELAFCYAKALGVKVDYEKAREWAEKATAQGDMYGKAILGSYYLNAKKDAAKGIPMLQESADANCAAGQYMLSRCFDYGKGVELDKEKARILLQKAVDQGLDDAIAKSRIKAEIEKAKNKQ